MLEKHIQLMHGIKDPDLKEMTEASTEDSMDMKEDVKVCGGTTHLLPAGLWLGYHHWVAVTGFPCSATCLFLPLLLSKYSFRCLHRL